MSKNYKLNNNNNPSNNNSNNNNNNGNDKDNNNQIICLCSCKKLFLVPQHCSKLNKYVPHYHTLKTPYLCEIKIKFGLQTV